MRTFFFIVSLLLFIVHDVFSNSKQTFDFIIVENNIVVKVETDNGILNLLFDTGSNLSILDSTVASHLNLPFLSETYMPTPVARSIKVYNTEFHLFDEYNLHWVITSMSYQAKSLNYPIHGLFGVKNVLKKEIIDIDFENHKIHIGNPSLMLINSFYSINLINVNRSVSGLGIAFGPLPGIRGSMAFGNNKSIAINLVIDTGCHYDFALISQDSLLVKFANKREDYFLMNGVKTLLSFGKVCVSSKIKISCGYKPFFYNPTLSVKYMSESIGLIGIPTLKKCKRIIINWPEKVMYVKKI